MRREKGLTLVNDAFEACTQRVSKCNREKQKRTLRSKKKRCESDGIEYMRPS